MTTTNVQIESEGQAATTAVADVQRYSPARRTGLGITFFLVGVVAAAAAAIVPTPHVFCTTWLFPLIGGAVGYMTYKTEIRVSDIKGPCPSCSVDIRLVGGTSERLEVPCPKCFKPLVIALDPAAGV